MSPFSLDGYRENHDRNRKTMDSKPTFDKIIANIKRYQKLNKKEKLIIFNCCFDDYTNLYECAKFFQTLISRYSVYFIKQPDYKSLSLLISLALVTLANALASIKTASTNIILGRVW